MVDNDGIDQGDVLGDLGLSVPTDEAIKQLTPELIEKYPVLYINVKTLIRNAVGVIAKEEGAIPLEKVWNRVMCDIDTLDGYLKHMRCYWILYHNTLADTFRLKGMRGAVVKVPKTTKQLEYQHVEHSVVTKLLEEGHIPHVVNDALTPMTLAPSKNAIIISHLPTDLLKYHEFDDLLLLESHTGRFKNKVEWSSKLNISSELRTIIPFNEVTLQIFGDGETVQGRVSSVKQRVIELAKKYSWNASTTMDRTRFVLEQDPIVRDLIRMFF